MPASSDKPGPGRPAVLDRAQKVLCRFPFELLKSMDAAADAAGMNRQEFIRECVRRGVKRAATGPRQGRDSKLYQ